MEKTIGDFVNALRKADLAVSPAESLDAMAALRVVGLQDRSSLKRALAIVLAKDAGEKHRFDACFDRFFSDHAFHELKGLATAYRQQQALGAERQAPASRPGGTGGDEAGVEAGVEDAEGRRHRHQHRGQRPESHLGQLLLAGEEMALLQLMMRSAQAVQLPHIRSLRERSLYAHRILLHMGIKQLDEAIAAWQRLPEGGGRETAELLQRGRDLLAEKVLAYVEEQYRLLVDASGQKFILEEVAASRLTTIQPYYLEHLREVVRRLAHRIAKQHAKRHRRARRGQLDLRRTLRRNLAFDGALYDLRWKRIKLERPKVFVLCDVSGSVRNVSRFLLTFLYSLAEVLPHVRAFAFSDVLGEVTELFRHYSVEEATEMSLADYGKGSTDYGQALREFSDLALRDLDSRSTVVILGDARNNYYDTRVDLLREIARRSRQVIWLNPEQRSRWQEGDAVMGEFLPHCAYAEVCNSVQDLERFVGAILRPGRS